MAVVFELHAANSIKAGTVNAFMMGIVPSKVEIRKGPDAGTFVLFFCGGRFPVLRIPNDLPGAVCDIQIMVIQ